MKRLTKFMPVICTFSILYFYTLLFSNYVPRDATEANIYFR